MRSMGILPEMTLAEAMECSPYVLDMLQELGLCCVNEENEELPVLEICDSLGVDADDFVAAVNALL